MGDVNVGIIGVGNCASSLVQGVEYYRQPCDTPAGLTNPICAGYAVSDIRFTAAFDVHAAKIGSDLSEAIWAAPNNALKFADVPELGVRVVEGILSDGVGESAASMIEAHGDTSLDDIVDHLKRSGTHHVVVNFLPAGSQRASELYAEAALQAGCAFVNCIPSVIARAPEWSGRFAVAGIPLLGDDLKSQFGATLVHHALMDLLANNGLVVRSTYQIVGGGNMDFLNLQDGARVESKKTTKLQGFGGQAMSPGSGHFGAEYIPFLNDRKITFIRLEAKAFGGTQFELDLRMTVEDSPSAAGNVLDAVRYVKFAMGQGIGGVIDPVSALLMKATPTPMSERDMRVGIQAFLTKPDSTDPSDA